MAFKKIRKEEKTQTGVKVSNSMAWVDDEPKKTKAEKGIARNKNLFGVACDEKVYKAYSEKTYIVPNDFAPDKPRNLRTIAVMANSAEFAEHYPEFVKACQGIVEQATEELKKIYEEGKVEKVMKHESFEGYLRDLQEVHKKASSERMEILKKFNREKDSWDEKKKDTSRLSEYDMTAAKMRFLEAEREKKEAIADLEARTKEEIKNIRMAFDEHITDFYSANGSRIDDATVRLLNSGLKLNDNEINRLISQNMGNPTMLRLIADHCTTNNIDNSASRIYGMAAKSSGKHETKIFEQVVDMIYKATGTDDVAARTYGIEKGNFERLSNGAIENLNSMSVKPAVAENSEG